MLLEMKVPIQENLSPKLKSLNGWLKMVTMLKKIKKLLVDSDKATLALPARGGTIKLVAQEGDTVEVGQVVRIIDTDGVGEASQRITSRVIPDS